MHDLSAVDVQGLASDVPRVVRREVSGHGADFLWGLPLGDGRDFSQFVTAPRIEVLSLGLWQQRLSCLPNAFVERCSNHPRCDGVHADAMRSEVLGCAFGETDEARFCCGVRRVSLRTNLSGDRY